jgi:cytochrome oxidase Cu insertion factor (SCO1/SenC/PrrC family)
LTGDPSSIRQAARAYKVYYAKVPTAGDDYTVDHSGYIYLMDRAGQYLGFFHLARRPTVSRMSFGRC